MRPWFVQLNHVPFGCLMKTLDVGDTTRLFGGRRERSCESRHQTLISSLLRGHRLTSVSVRTRVVELMSLQVKLVMSGSWGFDVFLNGVRVGEHPQPNANLLYTSPNTNDIHTSANALVLECRKGGAPTV